MVWAPEPGAGFKSILEQLIKDHHAAGNLVPDAMLAALAIGKQLKEYAIHSGSTARPRRSDFRA